MRFFEPLFWQIFYKVVKYGHNKKCETQFYIYNTTFYNHINKLRDRYINDKYGRKQYPVEVSDLVIIIPFIGPTMAANKKSKRIKEQNYINDLNHDLRTQGIPADALREYMHTYPTFLHIFEDA